MYLRQLYVGTNRFFNDIVMLRAGFINGLLGPRMMGLFPRGARKEIGELTSQWRIHARHIIK